MRKELFFITILLALAGCDQLRKKENVGEVLPLAEVPPSYLSFRVNFPASELESGLNRVLPEEFLNEALPLKDRKDTLFLKLTRKGQIQLDINKGTLEAVIPLDVTASVRKKVFGITFSNKDAPVHFSGSVKVTADVKLRDDWELDVICKWEGFTWSDQPKISLGTFSMDIGSNVDRFLENHSDLLSDVICGAIHRSISFRQVLTRVWADIQEPIRIKTPDRDLWLHAQPIALSGLAIPKEDTLTVNLEYRTALNLALKPSAYDRQPLPDRSVPLNEKSAFLAYPEVFLAYDLLQNTLQEKLQGQEVTYQDYTAVIENVSVGPEGQRLKVKLDLTGDIEGTLALSGTPHLDKNLQLSLEDFDYKLESSDDWVAFTEMTMHSFVEEYMSSFLNVDLNPILDRLDHSIVQGVHNSELGDKLSIQMKLNRIESYQLRMTEEGVQWIFFIEGASSLNLKRGIFESSK